MHPLRAALAAFERDESITEALTSASIARLGDASLIEVMYEAQAGAYTSDLAKPNVAKYTQAVAEVFADWINRHHTVLDVGTGEGNRLIAALQHADHLGRVRAVDIAWSRLSWAVANAIHAEVSIEVAVADTARLPMPDRSVDWVLSIHALEPNRGREAKLLAEMGRVARIGLLLIEPDYEIATQAQRERMTRLGFVRDIRGAAAEAGLHIIHDYPLPVNDNHDNPASVFVMEPNYRPERGAFAWCDPIEGEQLMPFGGGLRSPMGLWFPVLGGIPFLREHDALMAAKPAPGVS